MQKRRHRSAITTPVSYGTPSYFEPIEGRVMLSATMGGVLWHDLNANGIREAGEPVMPGVTLDLVTSTGGYVGSTATDADGKYVFADLAPGTYRASALVGAGFERSPQDQGDDDTVDSDLNEYVEIANTTLADDQVDLTRDGGVFKRATLGDYVWDDADRDGVQDANEQGLANVMIDLLSDTGAYLGTTYTDAQGKYKFENLLPGAYKMHVIAPAGYQQTVSNVGSDATDSDLNQYSETSPITILKSGDNADHVDAGFYSVASPIKKGQAAGIGFWISTKGQNLIKSLNGGSNSKALSTYLSSTYSKLYGSKAGSMNLTGKTNAQVASFVKSVGSNIFKLPEAQVLAIALSTYVTDSDLAGNAGKSYGFKVDSNGLGAATLNLGLLGPIYGKGFFASTSVGDLLKATNDRADKGVLFDGSLIGRLAATATYTLIAIAGDI